MSHRKEVKRCTRTSCEVLSRSYMVESLIIFALFIGCPNMPFLYSRCNIYIYSHVKCTPEASLYQ